MCVAAGWEEQSGKARQDPHAAATVPQPRPQPKHEAKGLREKRKASNSPHAPHPLTPRNSGQEHGENAHGRCGRYTHAKAATVGGGWAQPKPHPTLTCVLAANPLRKRTFTGTTALIYGSPPPSGKRAEPAHDTTFPVYPAPPPPGTSSISIPSPHVSGTVGDVRSAH